MAKGLFGGLKGVDAFGKASGTRTRYTRLQVLTSYERIDYGRCEGQDEDRSFL